MKVTLTVCEVCEDTSLSTKPYEIKSGDRKAKIDLCEAHAQNIEAYLPRTSTPTRRGGRRKVTTIEEIEARKN